jgi:uncharacterized protein
MTSEVIANHISIQSGIPVSFVKSTAKLLEGGATIPFIARYRKELTGNLDETQIALIHRWIQHLQELEARRQFILQSIGEQGKMTDELRQKIETCMDTTELEDLYLPYKRKKKTRAEAARLAGLEPLAKIIMAQNHRDPEYAARQYLNETIRTVEEALDGAKDIIAEWVSEDIPTRERLRHECRKYGNIWSEVVAKKKDEAMQFRDYFSFRELLSRCPSHRYLAIMRGHAEGLLKTGIQVDDQRVLDWIKRKFIKGENPSSGIIAEAIEDSYTRLLFPSVESQILAEFKERADNEAIKVFTGNLEQLLLAPPLGEKVVLAVDPGYRTGSKAVVLNSTGKLLEYQTIFPLGSSDQSSEAGEVVRAWCYKYNVEAIAIGNGTASRENKDFFEKLSYSTRPEIYVVSESGASIYSASDIAREEFPDLDLTYRGAVSIGRRLMDPLAELVKIDPKSIGVGQYQHDVNQTKLKDALNQTVESCVNRVGVNLNTASKHLLSYVSGFGMGIAEAVVKYRDTHGHFKNRFQLMNVPRLGQKTFEQCAGFLRIRDGENILDNTGVHPESYHIVKRMAADLNIEVEDLIRNPSYRSQIKAQDYVTEEAGLPTVLDIVKELEKPGLDPRGVAKNTEFDRNVQHIQDLKEGMILKGIVTNLTNFGAFVDIGVKQDGLIHISQITDKFIRTPGDILKLGQEVTVKVLQVEPERKRINLSMKSV